jgi:hypothetical protein
MNSLNSGDPFAVAREYAGKGSPTRLVLVSEALLRLEEQFETLRNFAEACCEIIERSRNPVEEIASRLDDVRAIAYPARDA